MDSTKRFSDRVQNYVRYRPGYPEDAIDYLIDKGINRGSKVCDIGSGTGILSELLLKRGIDVIGIEPNNEMREFAEQNLKKYPNFISEPSSAETTNLNNDSVEAITVAQAFHWFDRDICRKEFSRILKSGGKVFLLWNRRKKNSDFLREYDETLKKHSSDYERVNHSNLTDRDFSEFFVGDFEKAYFYNSQMLDWNSFLGRVSSASYTPGLDSPKYKGFYYALEELFSRHEKENRILLEYDTVIVSGTFDG